MNGFIHFPLRNEWKYPPSIKVQFSRTTSGIGNRVTVGKIDDVVVAKAYI